MTTDVMNGVHNLSVDQLKAATFYQRKVPF